MKFIARIIISGLAAVSMTAASDAAPPKRLPPREHLPPTLSWLRRVEAAQMLGDILRGAPPISTMGWFHPGQGGYGWKWLAARLDKNHNGAIERKEFCGTPESFDRLDRNHDGRLTAADFDWSDTSPINRQMRIVNPWFGRIDADHDEKITAAEWQAIFERAAKGKGSLGREELHALMFPPPRPSNERMPSKLAMVTGLFCGEIGSMREGPEVGQPAPEFHLRAVDNRTSFALSQFRGKKPVVLIFGSFT